MKYHQPAVLVYFSPVPWASYPQRPHYFARHALEQGGEVIWIDPYPQRLPTLRDLRSVWRRSDFASEPPARLTVLSVRALPLEPLAVGRWLNRRVPGDTLFRRLLPLLRNKTVTLGIGRPSGLALAALSALRPAASFYDAMDDFPEFYRGVSKRSVRRLETAIVNAVDLVITSSAALWTKFEALRTRRVMVHNAFDMSALPPLPLPRTAQPVFGYVGCIGHWFDWTFVIRLARAFEHATIHIVGPLHSKPPNRLPSNVRFFPPCVMSGAIEHFRSFSVGLIPFKRIPLTAAVDPIKYYAYRGMALPVLSTMFGEMTRRGLADGTFLAGDDEGFEEIAEAAARARLEPHDVDRFRREHTWEQRLESLSVFQPVIS